MKGTADRRAYVDRLLAGDFDGARHHIEGLLDRLPAERIILDVLAPAQTEIGMLWETNRCSVADEHVATSITDSMLALVGAANGAQATPKGSATIAVACVEGDWHSVPARMAAELLRCQGFGIRFLGGSLPADHLEGYLAKLEPAAVCLSCSLPLYLPGALRSIEAAHRVGVPVMAGGRGFGHDEHAALRLGADAWSRNVTTSQRRLTMWSRRPPRQLAAPAADSVAWSAIELAGPEIVNSLMGLLTEHLPFMEQFDEKQIFRTREDLTYIVRFLAVALLVDDDRIFIEFLIWLSGVLSNRNLPPSTLGATLPVLTRALTSADLLTGRIERLLQAASESLPQAAAAARR